MLERSNISARLEVRRGPRLRARRLFVLNRFDYLDGLRGLAAVQVLLHHSMLAFFPSQSDALGFLVDEPASGVLLLSYVLRSESCSCYS
jgi:hypothetical protein